MLPILTTTLEIAISVGLVVLALVWARYHTSDLSFAGEMMDSSYRAAQRLIKDDSTPDSILEFIERFSEMAGRPQLARGFVIHLVTSNSNLPTAGQSRFANDLARLNGEQRTQFAELVVDGMIASAAADPIFSRLYLFVLSAFFSKSGRRSDREVSAERAKTAALDITRQFGGHCPA